MEKSFSQSIRRLERQLKEVRSERDAFEQDVSNYAQQNKVLKEQVNRLHSTHTDTDSRAVQVLNEIRAQHKQLTDLRADEYAAELKGKEEKIKVQQEAIKKLKLDYEKMKLTEKENKSSSSKFAIQAKALEDKITKLQKESEEKDQVLANTKAKIEHDNDKSASRHRVRIKILEDQLKSSNLEKEEIGKELYKTKSKLENEQSKIESALSKHKLETKSLQDKIKQLQRDVKEQSDKYNKATEQAASIETAKKSSSLKQKIHVQALEDKFSNLKAELSEKDVQLSMVNSKLANEQSKIESASAKHKLETKSLQDKIKQLQRDVKEQSDKYNKATEHATSLESENKSSSLKHRIKFQALEDKIANLKTELSEKDGQLCSASNRLMSLEKKDESVSSKYKLKMERLQENINQLNKENDSKEQKLNKAKLDIENLESECDSLSSKHRIQLQNVESKIVKLKCENREKDKELDRVSSKLSGFENDSQTNLKQKLHCQSLEEKVRRLEIEVEQKNDDLCRVNGELDSHKMDVKSLSTQQKSKLSMLEEKVKKLEIENKNKEDQLCKVSSKLAHTELEGDSVASSYRVRVRALEDKIDRLRNENKQKEEQLIIIESEKSQVESNIHSLKDKIRRMEMEKNRKEEELVELRSVEHELASQSSETSSQIQSFQREKKKLEMANTKMKRELSEITRKLSSLECDLAEAKCSLLQKERLLERAMESEKRLKEETNSQEHILRQQVDSISLTNQRLKADLHQANQSKKNLIETVDDLSMKMKSEEKHRKNLEERTRSDNVNLTEVHKEQKEKIKQQNLTINNLCLKIERLENDLESIQDERDSAEEKFKSLEGECSILQSMKIQLQQYKEKCDQMQSINMELVEQQETLIREHSDVNRRLESMDVNHNTQSNKVTDLEKTGEVLKESCMMLEKQAEDLESFNNQLIEKQNKLTIERDEALKKCSSLEMELCTSRHQLKTELSSLDQCSSDQITELKIELRNEMNQAHEAEEQQRDLERRYKLLELNAAALQRKLHAEKDGHDRNATELTRVRGDMEVLQQSLKQAERNLYVEIDRCDVLERERTQMLNRVDTEKLDHSHELVRLNCQGAQQTKLIDFLQSRIEELEPSDKKKKKHKKTTLYQAPLQYRELCELLEEEKASNVRLQEQVNLLRSELQATNSKVKRMKHGMDVPLSPGSIAAISAIVKSPATSSTGGALSPKGGKMRSKPRMHHNIPHRLTNWLCNQATRCSVCLAILHFGHSALKCSECSVVCHIKCRKSVTNTCGLPGGLFQQFKDGAKSSNLSPITCVFKGGNADQLHGRLKVLCGNDSWTLRSIRVCSGHLRIAPPNAKSPSKVSDKDDIIDLTQAAYIHTDLCPAELPNTAKQDLSYAFKIQTGSSSSCWPARSVYLLAAGFAEKHLWVEKLEAITSLHNKDKNITANAKIFGNEILTMLSDEKLEINCSVPISDKNILFGCDEGLFLLSPSTSMISSRGNMQHVKGTSNIFQMTMLNKSQVIAIEGGKHKLVTFDLSSIFDRKVTLQHIDDMEGCHLFTVGKAEGSYYLCVASASHISVLKYNDKMKKFCKKKEIATSEPCTCMVFTLCSVIIGTNSFYEIDLTDYKVDEFVNGDDITCDGLKDGSVFPVSILKIKEHSGKQEFLLCFHEFGIFVDGFGRPTRSGQITWSRMPLSFEYREPYLVIVQFNSVEIIQIDVNSSSTAEQARLDHAFLSFPSARYVGPAITSGAIYLSSSEGSRLSVFCCKGNMNAKSSDKKVASSSLANKRHYAALSSSMDSLASPATKRSSAFTDMSNVSSIKTSRGLSSSCHSISSDSSRWTADDTSRWTTLTGSVDDDLRSTVTRTTADSDIISNSSEESMSSDTLSCQQESNKLKWHPIKTTPKKPARKRKAQNKEDFNPIPSTEV